MKIRTIGLVVWALALLVSGGASTAKAVGVGDPLPLLNNTLKAKHQFSIPGVFNGPGVATVVRCTSAEPEGGAEITFAVEFFSNGTTLLNDVTVGVGVMTLDPGDSDTMATQDTDMFIEQQLLSNPAILDGSARVLSTSKKVLCTAHLLDPTSSSPAFLTTLPVIRKNKQGGA